MADSNIRKYSEPAPMGYYIQQTEIKNTIRRAPIMAEFNSPGPGKYMLPPTLGIVGHDFTRRRNPAYTMANRHKYKTEFISPGPAAYDLRNMTRLGPAANYAYTISGWPAPSKKYVTPGPSHYRPEDCTDFVLRSAPKYTMGMKTKGFSQDRTPGPADYLVPRVPEFWPLSSHGNTPKFTFGIKGHAFSIAQTPGPSDYATVNPDIYLKKSPAYTMGDRSSILQDWGPKPGPADYSVNKVWIHKKTAPRFTFGIRHSPFVVTVNHLDPK
ncbi:ciliary microtubule associated protein 1A-like [Centruroides vittatus]|uniref:ciliary microtubule associated protein 1A-like n=1 Tax=Centruroides vittatus TaxID=120091 RepID=UPI00350F4443